MSIEERIEELKQKSLPQHIGIIMDGNGRWAQSRGKPRTYGHQQGVETVDEIVTCASKLGIGALTLYSFSSENWKRPPKEISFLMNLLTTYLKLKLRKFTKNNIRFRAMGRLEELDPKIHELIHYTIEKTKNNTGMILNLALNYSGRIELQDAIYQILETDRKSPLKKEEITDQLISSFLYEPKIPDPDLIIRTSNEFRISNFLLWQSAYSEYYFSEKLWPDFKSNDFMDALDDFFTRDRRYGGVKNAD